MNTSEKEQGGIPLSNRKAYHTQIEEEPPSPQADIGVLLVHGIGNHREGVTLRTFGQPMLNWLKDWLRATGGQKMRGRQIQGELVVTEARFNDEKAPAYAVAQIWTRPQGPSEKRPEESWLFCEGWWGSTVQSPASLQLLRWMWTRGPLLIYWHFYIRQTAEQGRTKTSPGDVLFSVVALLLAGFCQLVIGVAMLLSLIPIGPLRRKVVEAVRVLTLTLGDSYVLEEDIQRAALVERVRRALEWLGERTKQTVVVAHSQGGAIAHEVLLLPGTCSSNKVSMFISIGSGLEKLHFLRQVLVDREGLIVAWLLCPLVVAGVAMLLKALLSSAERWEIALGILFLLMAIVLSGTLRAMLQHYKEQLTSAVSKLELKGLARENWIDIYASDDVVPMSRGSLLDDKHFLIRRKVYNERSYVHDHVSYFANLNDCLPKLWESLDRISGLSLFGAEDKQRLDRFARVHKAHAHIISFSRLALFIAIFLAGYVLRNSLLSFGQSVLSSVNGTLVGDWLKPIQAFASMVAAVVKRVWNTDAVTADVLSEALFGGLVLFGTIALWWIIFRAFWLSRCAASWRKAYRGGDVLHTRTTRITFFVACIAFLCFGCLPLIVSIILATSPNALTVATFGKAIAITLSGIALVFGLFFAATAPWVTEAAWNQTDEPWLTRISSPLGPIILIFVSVALVRWLLPWAVSRVVEQIGLAMLIVVMAIAWQVYGVRKMLSRPRILRAGCIILFPILGTFFCFWSHAFPSSFLIAVIYFALTLAVLLSIFLLPKLKVTGA